MRLVFCLFYPTIHPTNYPTISCIKVSEQKIRHYILRIYLQYNTKYSACGWGSWIHKERNSDCSPQAQSRQQRMTESEEVWERENRAIFTPEKLSKNCRFGQENRLKTY